jgi:hypothetical protein
MIRGTDLFMSKVVVEADWSDPGSAMTPSGPNKDWKAAVTFVETKVPPKPASGEG